MVGVSTAPNVALARTRLYGLDAWIVSGSSPALLDLARRAGDILCASADEDVLRAAASEPIPIVPSVGRPEL